MSLIDDLIGSYYDAQFASTESSLVILINSKQQGGKCSNSLILDKIDSIFL